eukprot:TRINITY_DN8903_c0_g1_i1.p1 TRINITY_DN8903_c0_g1~~TRINITY_DN8903_c0_g1_i1.p1  ORF type:complete len:91 (-),score=11.74 TRINITY_DN8903_c0_g1_i1:1-273(-)
MCVYFMLVHNIEAFLKQELEVEFITGAVRISEELAPFFAEFTSGPTWGIRFINEDDNLISPMNGVRALSIDLAWATANEPLRQTCGLDRF